MCIYKWKSPILSGKKWHKTHPQPPIPSNRHPSSNWYGYPSSCNNKCEKVSFWKIVRMFAERLTSAAIIFFILLLILWLLHCVQIPFLHCAKTQALQVIDSLPVLLIALAFFTLLIFVCRRLSKDLSMRRIGCTQLLRQFLDMGINYCHTKYLITTPDKYFYTR